MEVEHRGGVLVHVSASLGSAERTFFLPAEVAKKLAPLASLTRVPGTRPPVAGIALAEGAVVTVLDLSAGAPPATAADEPLRSWADDDWCTPGADRALLCDLGGENLVALTGGTVVATGLFEAGPEGSVIHRGARIPLLDVAALHALSLIHI